MKAQIAFATQLLHYILHDEIEGIRIWRPRITWVGLTQEGKAVLLSSSHLDLLALETEQPGWEGVLDWLRWAEEGRKAFPFPMGEDAIPQFRSRVLFDRPSENALPALHADEEVARRLALAWIASEASRNGIEARIQDGMLEIDGKALPFPIRPLEMPAFTTDTGFLHVQDGSGFRIPLSALPESAYSPFWAGPSRHRQEAARVEVGKGIFLGIVECEWGGQAIGAWSFNSSYDRYEDRHNDYEIVAMVSAFIRFGAGNERHVYFAVLDHRLPVFVEAADYAELSRSVFSEDPFVYARGKPMAEVDRDGYAVRRGPYWPPEIDEFVNETVTAQEAIDFHSPLGEVTRRVYLGMLANEAVQRGLRVEILPDRLRVRGLPVNARMGLPPDYACVEPGAPHAGYLPLSGRVWVRRAARPPQPWALRAGRWAAVRVSERDAVIVVSRGSAIRAAGMMMAEENMGEDQNG